MVQKIAEQLLNRKLRDKDGFSKSLVDNAERHLGFALPSALRSFYLKIGNNQQIAQSFNRFLMPSELAIEHNKLIFCVENQQACFWAIDIHDNNPSPTVYQVHADDESYSEHIDLAEFLRVSLYYQLAQGGYEHCGTIDADDKTLLAPVLTLLATDSAWQKVVAHDSLVIYCNQCQLIWYFTDQDGEVFETVFASCLHPHDLSYIIKQYRFSDLN